MQQFVHKETQNEHEEMQIDHRGPNKYKEMQNKYADAKEI